MPRRPTRIRLPLLAAVLAASGAGGLRAQTTDGAPESLWWSVGVGAGSLHFECEICASGRDLGPTVELAVGAYASSRLLVGLEGGGWTHDDDGTRETAYRAGLVARFHPSPSRGLHLIGAAGWTGWRAEAFRYDAARLAAGAGWDLPLAGDWSVGNALLLEAAAFGDLKNDDLTVVEGPGLSMIRFVVHLKHR